MASSSLPARPPVPGRDDADERVSGDPNGDIHNSAGGSSAPSANCAGSPRKESATGCTPDVTTDADPTRLGRRDRRVDAPAGRPEPMSADAEQQLHRANRSLRGRTAE